MSEKKRIRELIVVEGKNDTARLKQFYDCDTIETGGTSLGDEVLELIRYAQQRRGVIVFTDPDSPGNRIRNAVNRAVPECKNAFVDKVNARTEKKVGVEHASFEVIDEALSNLVTWTEKPNEEITSQDFYELGLTGKENSGALREKAGRLLHIGNGTAKTMRYRINCLGITREELKEVLENG